MAKGGRPGGATVVKTATDRKTGERYRARPGEVIVRMNGRELKVENARKTESNGYQANYSARINGRWVPLSQSNQYALQDFAKAALKGR